MIAGYRGRRDCGDIDETGCVTHTYFLQTSTQSHARLLIVKCLAVFHKVLSSIFYVYLSILTLNVS